MKDKKTAVGLACQIVWEYSGWGDEHIFDMLQTYKDCGDPVPCNYDELQDLANKAQRLKDAGSNYETTETQLLGELCQPRRKGSTSRSR